MVDEKKKSNENDQLIRLTLIDIYQSRHQTNGSEFSPRSIRSDLRRCNNKNATVPGALDASAANREKTEYKGKRHLTGLYTGRLYRLSCLLALLLGAPHFDPDGSPPPRQILIRFALFLRPIYSFYFFLYKRPNCYRGNNRISRPPFNHSSFRRAPISFANFSLSLFALRLPNGRRRTSTIREKTAKNKIDIHKHTWERRENNIKSNFQYSTRSIHL